ncbi:ABC transporter substrate-binding protein [Tissierellaceae bacterium HCP3S3_D8]
MKRKLKSLLSIILVFSMLLAITACGGNTSASSKGDGKIKIRLLTRMAGTTPQVQIYNDILEQFEIDHDDVEIVDESQGDESAFNNILKTSRASDDLPHIFRIQGVANLDEYIDNKLIMDLAPVFEEDKEWSDGFTEGAVKYYEVPGYEGIYAVPMESGIIGVYYNEELFTKAGISGFPETWTEFKSAIGKLNAINITPIALGAKASYTAGHLHNLILYRWLGNDVAKKLGSRELAWDSPEIIETLEFIKELKDINAFDKNAAGIDDNVALSSFQNGEAGMVITGPWNASPLTNTEKSKVGDKVRLAKFPYFEEKPEFKDNDMQVISPYMINGKLEGKEKEYTIELVKRLTSAEAAKRFAEEANFMVPRTDIDIDESKVEPIFLKNLELAGTSIGAGVDSFDYDPLQSMQDRTRNSIVSIISGASPSDAAKEIQEEINNREQ